MKNHKRRARRLVLEALENRAIPSSVVSQTSPNWSGYAIDSSVHTVTYVAGSWTVPTVSGRGISYSSSWVGIDGSNSRTVEQIGTDSDIVNGVPTYYAWYEMYPSGVVKLSNIAVSPGDVIYASVSYSGGYFILSLNDGNQQQVISQYDPYTARSSAEWIEEAPSSSRSVLPLANFGQITFANAVAVINGGAGSISAGFGSNTYAYAIDMRNRGISETWTSPLYASGFVFTVAYLHGGSYGSLGSNFRTPDAADIVAPAFDGFLTAASVTSQNSDAPASGTTAAAPAPMVGTTWIPVAAVRPTYYADAPLEQNPAIAISELEEAFTLPPFIEARLGQSTLRGSGSGDRFPSPVDHKPTRNDAPAILDDGNALPVDSSSVPQPGGLPSFAGFLGMIFVAVSTKPNLKKSLKIEDSIASVE